MDDDGTDEALPQSSLPPGRRRLLLAAAILVVVALIVVAAVRVSTRSTPRADPSRATVTPTTSHGPAPQPTSPPRRLSKPPAVLHVLRRLDDAEIAAARRECPRLAPTCMTTGETPGAVVAALRAAFPAATHLVAVSDIAYSTTSGPRLVFRRLSARAGRLRLAVEVRQAQSDDGTGSQRLIDGENTVVRCQRVSRGLTIEIQGSAPKARYVDLARLRRAVADPRLLAIG